MIKSTLNRGFQITFDNGLTISVQFGTGNYCSRRNYDGKYADELKAEIIQSFSAEIAIWDKTGKWFNFGHDTVKGWCEADEVAKWIIKTQKAKSLKSLRK
jgi:hypothetical protein